MNDSNREQLIVAARLLRPLLGELVFVGGTVIRGRMLRKRTPNIQPQHPTH
jgi:hypothetical protein